MVLAQPMRDDPLRCELRRRAPEARPGGFALSERGRVALRVRLLRCAVVSWPGLSGRLRRRGCRAALSWSPWHLRVTTFRFWLIMEMLNLCYRIFGQRPHPIELLKAISVWKQAPAPFRGWQNIA